ncbi:hypothetical protein PHYNN_210 [Pantoea phage Phynn]|nr:hypothetical protein PHYNN_210 [Pantoea phage Phynn]
MNKLTAESTRQELTKLKVWENDGVLTLKEERYLQALEIALTVLEQQEKGEANREDNWKQRAEAAEAKCKQLQAALNQAEWVISGEQQNVRVLQGRESALNAEILALREMVSDEMPDQLRDRVIDICEGVEIGDVGAQEIWKACRAAILRNIKEPSK